MESVFALNAFAEFHDVHTLLTGAGPTGGLGFAIRFTTESDVNLYFLSHSKFLG